MPAARGSSSTRGRAPARSSSKGSPQGGDAKSRDGSGQSPSSGKDSVRLPPISATKTPTKPSTTNRTAASPRKASTARSAAATVAANPKLPASPSGLGFRKASVASPNLARAASVATLQRLPSTPGQNPATGGRLTREQRRERDERRKAAATRIQNWYRRSKNKLDWRKVVQAARKYAEEEAIRQAEKLQWAKVVLRRFFHYSAWRLRVVRRERNMDKQRICALAVQNVLIARRSECLARDKLFDRLSRAALLILARWKESAAFARVRWRKANEEVRLLLARQASVERRAVECAEEAEFVHMRTAFRAAPAMRRHVDATALERVEEAAREAESECHMAIKADHVGGAGRRLARGASRVKLATGGPGSEGGGVGVGAASRRSGPQSTMYASHAPGSMRWTQRLGQRTAASKARTLTASQVKSAIVQRDNTRAQAAAFAGMSFDDSFAPGASRRESMAVGGAVAGGAGGSFLLSQPQNHRGGSFTGGADRRRSSAAESGGMTGLEAPDGVMSFSDDDDVDPEMLLSHEEDARATANPRQSATDAAGAVDSSSLTWLLNAPLPHVTPDMAQARMVKQGASHAGVGDDWHVWFRATDYGRRSAGMQIVEDALLQQEAAQVARTVHDHAVERLLVQETMRRRRIVQHYDALAQGLLNSAAADRRHIAASQH